MPVVDPHKLVALQRQPEGVRNICILAHVDHGKTSLTDALIATNGIISPKLAGKIRYLDSRPDEQLRGITMESSAISLYFSMMRRSSTDSSLTQTEHLINLIDSPGHIDFSSEVSTASRLCDGALVLVDAVEGVQSQTVTVLRQIYVEHLQPLLVINKIDRLINELKMTPTEAYTHMNKLLEQVNAIVGSFFQGERMEEDLRWRERVEERVAAATLREKEKTVKNATTATNGLTSDEQGDSNPEDSAQFEEKDDDDLYFAPEKNNVIFSSAVDGWAFTVKQFAGIYEKKLGMKRAALEKFLWGDYYLDPKTKRVLGHKHLKGRPLKPMFVQLVLENIWAIYAATGGGTAKGDPVMVEKITNSLSIKLPPHILRSKDPRAVLIALFAAWLPLSTAVLVSVIEHIPAPPAAQATRLPAIIDKSPGSADVDPKVRNAMVEFKSGSEEPVVAYVSKMVAIRESELPENKRRNGALSPEEARELGRKKRAEIARQQALSSETANTDPLDSISEALGNTNIDQEKPPEDEPDDPEHLIGFARIYSGHLKVGDQVYVLPPKFSPSRPHAKPEPQKVTVTGLYLLMGRGLEPLSSVPAGVVFGIAGLAGHILKSGTLCSQLAGGINLGGVSMATQPIVRVALEPVNPSDLDKMIHGMQLLEQSDPCAEYEVLESGEHVILTAGELHLERCLKDLRERFARCEIQAGEPIVPYRETIVAAAEMAPLKEKGLPRGTIIGETTSKQVTLRLRVRPLPVEVTDFLVKHAGAVKRLYSERRAAEEALRRSTNGDHVEGETAVIAADEAPDLIETGDELSLPEFKNELKKVFQESSPEKDSPWNDIVEKIVAFGPKRVGPNLLIDATASKCCERFLQEADQTPESTTPETDNPQGLTAHDFSDKIAHAFQLATAQGPLCLEPMQGVAVFLEDISIALPPSEGEPSSPPHHHSSPRDHLGRLTGEVIKTTRESLHAGFLLWSPRLLLAMYSVSIQASAEVLGRVYGVITRRRGRIISEALNEGTPFFTVVALLPVAESFGFADEMRTRTSGGAQPQLIFAGFDATALDLDPFWVPRTEEEREDLGEVADRENVAKRYMDRVRTRKGLIVGGKKLVKDAEKQKTLKR